MFFFSLLICFVSLVFLILAVAFVTLFERHLLGLSQNRLGPNKVFFFGLFQPVLDGCKLMFKKQVVVNKSFVFFFLCIPGGVFFILFFEFFCLPFFFFFFNFQFSLLFLLCLVGVSIYFFIISSFISKSKYPFLGGVRSSSQSVSFEIVFTFFLFCFFFCFSCLELCFGLFLSSIFLFFFFLFMLLGELNRAPFDFSEGESELVSGFNTEFSSITFILLFLGEYGSLLFFSVLCGGLFWDSVFGFFFFFFLFLFIRSVYPRYRYDLLMFFFWKILLPASMVFFFVFFLFSLF